MGTAAPWKPRKNGTACFSSVPTALGKLGKTAPSFPQFPQPLRLNRKERSRKKALREKAGSNTDGQDRVRGVKTASPGDTPLAGFQVTTYGRF